MVEDSYGPRETFRPVLAAAKVSNQFYFLAGQASYIVTEEENSCTVNNE